MSTDNSNMSKRTEEFELILWLIERLDNQRSSVANRTAIVLSADALLLAAATFLLDKVLSNIGQYGLTERIVLTISIGTMIILLVLSIGYATTGIANVWKTTRESLGKLGSDMPKRIFFHPRDTIDAFGGFTTFRESFKVFDVEKLAISALAELWTVINQHHSRYQMLRKTIKLLIYSFIPFLIAVTTIFANFF